MAAYTTGVYQIKNKVNGKVYIGSSSNIERRWKQHILLLNRNSHHSQHLQSAWNKYGEINFEFSIVLTCKQNELLDKEQILLSRINPSYNMSLIAGLIEMTSATRQKIGNALRGRPKSAEHRAALSKAKLGKPSPVKTKEWIEKIRQSNIKTAKTLDRYWTKEKGYRKMQSNNMKMVWKLRREGA